MPDHRLSSSALPPVTDSSDAAELDGLPNIASLAINDADKTSSKSSDTSTRPSKDHEDEAAPVDVDVPSVDVGSPLEVWSSFWENEAREDQEVGHVHRTATADPIERNNTNAHSLPSASSPDFPDKHQTHSPDLDCEQQVGRSAGDPRSFSNRCKAMTGNSSSCSMEGKYFRISFSPPLLRLLKSIDQSYIHGMTTYRWVVEPASAHGKTVESSKQVFVHNFVTRTKGNAADKNFKYRLRNFDGVLSATTPGNLCKGRKRALRRS